MDKPVHLTSQNMAYELYARGYTATREDAVTLAFDQPKDAWNLLRRHHDPETASVAEWGELGTGNEAPKKKPNPGSPA